MNVTMLLAGRDHCVISLAVQDCSTSTAPTGEPVTMLYTCVIVNLAG